jgi:hypothetical protein
VLQALSSLESFSLYGSSLCRPETRHEGLRGKYRAWYVCVDRRHDNLHFEVALNLLKAEWEFSDLVWSTTLLYYFVIDAGCSITSRRDDDNLGLDHLLALRLLVSFGSARRLWLLGDYFGDCSLLVLTVPLWRLRLIPFATPPDLVQQKRRPSAPYNTSILLGLLKAGPLEDQRVPALANILMIEMVSDLHLLLRSPKSAATLHQ